MLGTVFFRPAIAPAGARVLADPDAMWTMTAEERAKTYEIDFEARIIYVDHPWKLL